MQKGISKTTYKTYEAVGEIKKDTAEILAFTRGQVPARKVGQSITERRNQLLTSIRAQQNEVNSLREEQQEEKAAKHIMIAETLRGGQCNTSAEAKRISEVFKKQSVEMAKAERKQAAVDAKNAAAAEKAKKAEEEKAAANEAAREVPEEDVPEEDESELAELPEVPEPASSGQCMKVCRRGALFGERCKREAGHRGQCRYT